MGHDCECRALTCRGFRARSSLAFQTPEDVAETLALVKQAAITMVSLPLVNEW